jgi:hypothetical protein
MDLHWFKSGRKILFFEEKNENTFITSMKYTQAKGEATSPQKTTSSSSKKTNPDPDSADQNQCRFMRIRIPNN